jgi:hypothetical protein
MSEKRDKNAFAGALLLIALVLFASPWLAGFGDDVTPAASAGVLGAAFVLLAFAAYVELVDWAARGAIGVGAWAMVAPVVLGFHADDAALWSHLVAGAFGVMAGVGGHDLLNRNPPEHRA